MLLPLLLLAIFPCSVLCEYRWSVCNNASTFTEGSSYSTNLDRVIADLSRNAPQNSGFNTSSRGQSPDKAYGLLQCIGNVSAAKCANCSAQAYNITQELCANDVGAQVWMDYFRYDNSNFISTLDTNFISTLDTNFNLLTNVKDVTSNSQAFISTTSSLLSNLSDQAYLPANKLLGVGSESYSNSDNVYGLVQCWRDLSVKDCRSCLFQARQQLLQCYSSRRGARAMSGSCTVRYEIYPFLDSAAPDKSFSLLKSSKDVSGNIQSFKSTTSSLLSNMSSDLANKPPYNNFIASGSANYSVLGQVNGRVRCSSGIPTMDCSNCLFQAKQLLEHCCSSKESAQATSENCMVGYQVQEISDIESPGAPTTSPTSTPSPPVEQGRANSASQAKSS